MSNSIKIYPHKFEYVFIFLGDEEFDPESIAAELAQLESEIRNEQKEPPVRRDEVEEESSRDFEQKEVCFCFHHLKRQIRHLVQIKKKL